MTRTCDSFRTGLGERCLSRGSWGSPRTSALSSRPVTAHYARKEDAAQPANLCHWHRPLRGAVLNVACQHHRADHSVRVPVPLIPWHRRLVPFSRSLVGATQAALRDSTHVSYPDPRIETLTPPAGAEQCSGYPSPVGRDPSDTETLTGPGCGCCVKGHGSEPSLRHADLPFSLGADLRGPPRVTRIAHIRLPKVARGHGGHLETGWGLGRRLPKQGHTPLASSAFPRAR